MFFSCSILDLLLPLVRPGLLNGFNERCCEDVNLFPTNSHELDSIIIALVRLAKAPAQVQLTNSGLSTNLGD